MLRQFVCAAAVLILGGSIALAETVRGTITKIDDKEVTIIVRKKGEKEGETKTFALATDVKHFKRKGKDDKEAITKTDFTKALEDSKNKLPASIEVNDDKKVTEIRVGERRKGKGT